MGLQKGVEHILTSSLLMNMSSYYYMVVFTLRACVRFRCTMRGVDLSSPGLAV